MIAKSVDIPRVSFYTVGCRLNQAETSLLQDGFRQKGFVPVAYGQETDLLVVNSCTVTEGAESDCRRVVRQVLRHSPKAFVAVTGCFAQTGFQALRRVEGIDLIVGNQFKMRLPDLFLRNPGFPSHRLPRFGIAGLIRRIFCWRAWGSTPPRAPI